MIYFERALSVKFRVDCLSSLCGEALESIAAMLTVLGPTADNKAPGRFFGPRALSFLGSGALYVHPMLSAALA